MSDIISLLKGALSSEIISGASQAMGESEDGIKKAFDGIVPTVLTGLMSKIGSGDSNTLTQLMGLFKSAPSGDSLLSNASGLLGALSGKGDLAGLAGKFLPMIMGNKSQGVTDLIANVAGIKSSSASSLFTMAVPMIMGALGKGTGGKFSLGSLLPYLLSQKDSILKAAPAGLGSALGISDLNSLGSNFTSIANSASAEVGKAAKKGSKLLPIIILLALLGAAAFFFLRGCSAKDKIQEVTQKAVSTVKTEATNVQNQATSLWAHLGTFGSVNLPNGIKLNIPEFGIENQLLDFIKDTNAEIDSTEWFSFDRLLFETGSATLKADSDEQLQNIAAILKAYPNVEMKLGGYTDNTGTPEANLALSQARAESVRNKLIAMGTDSSRLTAKGYGEEHPVAPNDTAENRAQNRRIDINITKK